MAMQLRDDDDDELPAFSYRITVALLSCITITAMNMVVHGSFTKLYMREHLHQSGCACTSSKYYYQDEPVVNMAAQ